MFEMSGPPPPRVTRRRRPDKNALSVPCHRVTGKLYHDLRHNFLVALTSHARRSRNNSYQRASFDSSLRSIVVIG